MLIRAIAIFCLALTLSAIAHAQATSTDQKPVAPSSATETSDSAAMEQPMIGDHWTYQVRDEITGTMKGTVTETITDVTSTEIAARTETVGTAGAAGFVYDHSWNLKSSAAWTYSPNDGTGVKLPLKAGDSWKVQADELYHDRSTTSRRSVSAKVESEEDITTDAGTFHTFKIVTTATSRNIHDPAKKAEATLVTWYAPSIDHWVKRTLKVATNGHVTQNISTTLVDCGRR
jgi:hypothetical protein